MSDYNEMVVFDAIRRQPEGLSRAELARRTGLSAQTIGNITARLMANGLISEMGTFGALGRGRPATRLRLNRSARFAIGVHFDPAVIMWAVVDLSGVATKTGRLLAEPEARPERSLEQVAETVVEVIATSGIRREHVLGVGVAMPGPIDAEMGTVIDPPMLRQWRDVPVRERIAELVGLPVHLDKDVNAAASAMLWSPDGPASSGAAFVYLGTGPAMSIVIDGRVVRGRRSNAGDIGNWLAYPTQDAECEPAVLVGESVGARKITEDAIRAGALPGGEYDLGSPRDLYRALAQLGAQAGDEDATSLAIVSRVTRLVAHAAGNVARLLELETVYFGGPMWEHWPKAQIALAQSYFDTLRGPGDLWSIEAASTPFGDAAGAIGGACVLLEHALSPRHEVLLLG